MVDEDPAGPTSSDNRIAALDSLRGIALFSILIANILDFSGVNSPGREWAGLADQAVLGFVQFFVSSKFLSLFAMLFGIGFAMQIFRLQRRAGDYLWIYGRRLLFLFGIGFLHLLMDPAEVLAIYALCGALLLLFRRFSAKSLICWALLVMALPHLHTAIVSTSFWAEAFPQSQEASQQAWNAYADETGVRVRAEGSLSDVVTANLQFTVSRFTESWINYLWMSVPLPLMLLGFLIGRSRIMERIDDERTLLRRATWYGIGTGIAGTLVSLALFEWAPAVDWNPWVVFAGSFCFVLSACLMAIGYGAGVVLLSQRNFASKLFVSFQAVGRLALTNYLLQTLICTTLFYNYGFGLFGALGPSVVVSTAAMIFLVQVALSQFWIHRYKFGPAEWLWRSLTYGQIQPMRSA